MPEMSDDMRRAVEAARNTQVSAEMNNLQDASSADVDKGPTTLPGETPGYGRNYNPVEAMPEPQPTIEPGE